MVDFSTFGLLALFAANEAAGEPQGSLLLNVAVLCSALAGACMGFLRFNIFPAHMIMGDTGSMFIGGAMAAVALMLRVPLLIVLICFCMLISSLSVLLQRVYFKLTHGRRIFKMSPLHHHFELLGVPETKIVSMYTIVTVLLCLLSLLGASR